MGSLCSKAGTHTSEDVVVAGGQNRLGGPARTIQSRPARPAPQKPAGRTSTQAHKLGGSADETPADPRAAAAEAAEQRMKAVWLLHPLALRSLLNGRCRFVPGAETRSRRQQSQPWQARGAVRSQQSCSPRSRTARGSEARGTCMSSSRNSICNTRC